MSAAATRPASGTRRDAGHASHSTTARRRGRAKTPARRIGAARLTVRRATTAARDAMASLSAAAALSATSGDGSDDRALHAIAGALLLALAGGGALTLSRARRRTTA